MNLTQILKTGDDNLIQTHPHTDLKLKMDYKLILESEYITKRMCEIANQPLEIGFVYGGTITTKKFDTHSQTTLDMKEMAIPIKQKVTEVTFNFDYEVLPKLENYFRKKDMHIIGQGHSHQNLPVFHSAADQINYKKMSIYCGIKIDPHKQATQTTKQKTFSSYSTRQKKENQVIRKIHKKELLKPVYVFPTLIFNTKGEMTAGLAASNIKKHEILENAPIEYYNKQAVLTTEEKQQLDKKIYEVLTENNIPFSYTQERKRFMKPRFHNVRDLKSY